MGKKKEQDDEIEFDMGCSYEDENGTIINTCEDLPVTYCEKCKRFYVIKKDGSHEEISISEQPEIIEEEQ